jgi:hypothetical protein
LNKITEKDNFSRKWINRRFCTVLKMRSPIFNTKSKFGVSFSSLENNDYCGSQAVALKNIEKKTLKS